MNGWDPKQHVQHLLFLVHLERNTQEDLGSFSFFDLAAEIVSGKCLQMVKQKWKGFSTEERRAEENIFDEKYNDLIEYFADKMKTKEDIEKLKKYMNDLFCCWKKWACHHTHQLCSASSQSTQRNESLNGVINRHIISCSQTKFARLVEIFDLLILKCDEKARIFVKTFLIIFRPEKFKQKEKKNFFEEEFQSYIFQNFCSLYSSKNSERIYLF